MDSFSKKWNFLALVTFCILPGITLAADTIGQVVWVKGSLIAQQPNQADRTLARRSPIYEADTLKTDATSTGQVVFTDNSILALKESTILAIAKYAHNPKGAPAKEAFVANLAKGGFRTITGAVAKENPKGYEAKTPVATIGVSGTEFMLNYNPANSKLDTMVTKGSIKVSNGKGTVTLQAGCTQEQYKTLVCFKAASTSSDNEAPVGSNETPESLLSMPELEFATFSSSTGGTGTGQVDNFSINTPCQQ